jgi:hypothetical protein
LLNRTGDPVFIVTKISLFTITIVREKSWDCVRNKKKRVCLGYHT